jgi:hypothetical protein
MGLGETLSELDTLPSWRQRLRSTLSLVWRSYAEERHHEGPHLPDRTGSFRFPSSCLQRRFPNRPKRTDRVDAIRLLSADNANTSELILAGPKLSR